MLKTSKKRENTLQESQSQNYNSTAPSGKRSEANTVANRMLRTTLLNSLNTGRYVPPEEHRHICNAIET